MKVLFLHKYGSSYATYRARLELFLPYLRAHGIECTVSTLIDSPREPTWVIAGRALRRAELLARARQFDLLVVYHEVFPHLPAAAEAALLSGGVPYVFDIDDAIHLCESRSARGKTLRLIEGASAVIAGSDELAQLARRVNGNTSVVPTVVDCARYESIGSPPAGTPFTIGWIGTPESTHYLEAVAEPLGRICARRGGRFVTIGASRIGLPGVRLEQKPWSEQLELAALQTFDVGIMPLKDDEWSRMKCGYKLVQYHAAGVPSVASPIGANRRIVKDGVTGFLASGAAEWLSALERLADDRELRKKFGAAAREHVRAGYSLASAAPLFHRILLEAAGTASAPGAITA